MAVIDTTSKYCCLNIQRSIETMMPNTKPSNFPFDNRLIPMLKSPENVGMFSIRDEKQNGKGRPQSDNECVIELEYEVPFCDDAVDGCLDVCGTLPLQGDSLQYVQVTIDHRRSYGGYFTEYDFECLCEAPNQRLAKRIDQGMQIVAKAVTEHVAQLMYAAAGPYSNGLASNSQPNYQALKLLNPNGHTNAAGMTKLTNEHRLQRSQMTPFIVGGLALENYLRVMSVGGLNGNHPVQPGDQTFGARIGIDIDAEIAIKAASGVTNVDHAISWAPGAFQFLEWYENEGYMEKFDDNYTYTTISGYGMTFDFYLWYDHCQRRWNWVICKAYDLFCLGESYYAPCITGNHKLHWTLDCAQFACEDYYVTTGLPSSS